MALGPGRRRAPRRRVLRPRRGPGRLRRRRCSRGGALLHPRRVLHPHGVEGDLDSVRAAELAGAARVLGVDPVRLLGYPDGALTEVDVDDLSAHVLDLAAEVGADGLLVFDADGVTGHLDHASATAAALAAADSSGLAVQP